MNHYDVIVLQAFLAALRRLDKGLPKDVQGQLQALAKSLAVDEGEVIKLDAIASSFPSLNTIYQEELASLKQAAGERSKGWKPLPLSQKKTTELINSARNVFSADDSVEKVKQSQPFNLLQFIQWLFTRDSN